METASNMAKTQHTKVLYWKSSMCWLFELTAPTIEETIDFFFHKHTKYVVAYWSPNNPGSYSGYVELNYRVNKVYWEVFPAGKFTAVRPTKFNRLSIPLKFKRDYDAIDNGQYFGNEITKKNNFSYVKMIDR